MANFQQLIQSHPKVLVDFSAAWCGPCKALAPILSEVKSRLGEQVKIVKIDVDRNPELASQWNVSGVPTMILFKDGKQVWRQSGVIPARQIEQVVMAN